MLCAPLGTLSCKNYILRFNFFMVSQYRETEIQSKLPLLNLKREREWPLFVFKIEVLKGAVALLTESEECCYNQIYKILIFLNCSRNSQTLSACFNLCCFATHFGVHPKVSVIVLNKRFGVLWTRHNNFNHKNFLNLLH